MEWEKLMRFTRPPSTRHNIGVSIKNMMEDLVTIRTNSIVDSDGIDVELITKLEDLEREVKYTVMTLEYGEYGVEEVSS